MSLQGQFLAWPLETLPLKLLEVNLEEIEDILPEESAGYDRDEVPVERTEEYR